MLLSIFLHANNIDYIQKAHDLNLSQKRYWHLLLHMKNGTSEIDDKKFFLSSDGKTNPNSELDATVYALLHEKRFDDNATACLFPARKTWLKKELNISIFPKVNCKSYAKILKKLDPSSATIVFPSAHINSPASMFGHTFLRINSHYKSKLLSYAINYAASIDEEKTNGISFAINGLVGGYQGQYSMLPYYEKLKEYRDSEQRDIWEYDLNLSKQEVLKMFQHIWELNGSYSDYYFFTENCSYNMLWLLEIANPNIHLRNYFTYHVSPLETIHAMKDEGIIMKESFRDSKRSTLLKYETIIKPSCIKLTKNLLINTVSLDKLMRDKNIEIQQKRYILEAAIELLEYKYMQGDFTKNKYLDIFHKLTTVRASLGMGESLSCTIPASPLTAHRQARLSVGVQKFDDKKSLLLGIRPVYNHLEDSNNGLLRGTQIEFLSLLMKIDNNDIKLEELTVLSIASIVQISPFFQNFSWRMNLGWDKKYIDNDINLNLSVGGGASLGNSYGYGYVMTDLLTYVDDEFSVGIGTSVGLVIDKNPYFKSNIELTKRWYYNGDEQLLIDIVQSYKISQNTQLKFKYEHKKSNLDINSEDTYSLFFNYYF